MKNHELPQFSAEELAPALRHIEHHWQNLEKFNPADRGTLIGLPHPYMVPSNDPDSEFHFDEMYYWDSYFTAIGLLGTSRQKLAFGMLENLTTLLKRFGMIPNSARTYSTSHSQPPFLTSFIMDLYAVKKNKVWLRNRMRLAEREYHKVWMGTAHPQWRQVYQGLSRYYDTNVIHDLAEAESGWDHTTRFHRACLNYLPVDLNSLLFRYEKDFERTAEILSEPREAAKWEELAKKRRENVDKYMWDSEHGFYFDYDYINHRRSDIWSLAAYYPMWAGMASMDQAKALVSHLHKFEHEGGLTTTAEHPKVKDKLPTQWAFPNGWAPLHLVVAYGLEAYGYNLDAQRIARKWLRSNLTYFNKHGVFLEKYNVVNAKKPPKDGVYPSQTGFGWTNAVFYRLCTDFLQPQELPPLRLARKRDKATNLISGAERQLKRFKVKLINTIQP